MKTVYYSFIHCHLLYGVEIYANTAVTNLDKLCKLNNKLIRILFNLKRDCHITDLYKKVDSLQIPLLFQMKMLEFVFKCIYDKLSLPSIFRDYFQRSKLTLNYDSRRKNDLFVPMSNFWIK